MRRAPPVNHAESAPVADARGPTQRAGWVVAGFTTALTFALFAPLFRSGTLILLDYSDYPYAPGSRLGSYAWGFPPGLTSRAPVNALLLALFHTVGWEPLKLFPFLLLAPLAAWGFHRLLGRRPVATIAATLLFAVNPFVLDRMLAGQIFFVLGYALLPLFLSLLLSEADGWIAPIVAGLVFALLIALAPHFVFVAGLLVLIVAATSVRSDWRRALARTGITTAVAVGASLYWIVPIAAHGAELGRVTSTDLVTFRTLADPSFGLGMNVAGLYGFWRQAWPLAKDTIGAWPLLLAALLVVAAIGLRAARSDGRKRLATVLLLCGALGFVLALGDRGPTGGAFRFLFEHFPGFRIMREPEKFEALLALAYAAAFGLGVSSVVRSAANRKARAIIACAVLAVPCMYTFSAFWGFDGYAQPEPFPASWGEASAVMGSGRGKVLALPGDQYLPFSWTQDRPVANPMASFFSRNVLIDGSLHLDGLESQTNDAESNYLRFVTDHGAETSRFGNLLAPLGVRYVLVAKTTDWRRYGWLSDQADLRLVREWPDLTLYENLEPVAPAYGPTAEVHVPDWGAVMALADRTSLTNLAVTVDHPAPGPIRLPAATLPSDAAAAPVAVPGASPTDLRVSTPSVGSLALSEPFDPAWRLDGRSPVANLGVTTMFEGPFSRDTAQIVYARWPLVRDSCLTSAAVIALALIAIACTLSFRTPIGLRSSR
ncbi:MAG: hypothetical protein ACJ758_00610 [Actinomycetota bacterium]